MKQLLLLTLAVTLTLCHSDMRRILNDPLSDEFIALVQERSTTWTAGRNFPRSRSMKSISRLMGVLSNSKYVMNEIDYTETKISIPEGFQMPESFDARIKWPYCPTINEIRDQGSCGSCWAIAAVEVMTDRTCTASGGKFNIHYSVEDLLTCCHNCGYGCSGGYPLMAYYYWQRSGIVSGGPYNSSEGCRPYEIPPCEHHMHGDLPDCDSMHINTPACKRVCESNYNIPYKDDLRRAEILIFPQSALEAQYDLIANGSITAAFMVYEDFLHYKSGVYQYSGIGALVGGHAIRIIGYGIENGVPYWLCANSWNADWGDKGFFKILRGRNECGIEGDLITGLPEFE